MEQQRADKAGDADEGQEAGRVPGSPVGRADQDFAHDGDRAHEERGRDLVADG